MKKLLLLIVSIMAIFTLAACGDKTPTCLDTEKLVDGVCVTPAVEENAPVITGATDVTIEKNSVFKMFEGLAATDVEDGDLTASIELESGSVFTSSVGEYVLTYSVTDADGHKTEVSRTVTVVYTDVEAPLVSGIGNSSVRLGIAFDAKTGVTAADTVDGDLTSSITVTGEVNVFIPGDYTLTYTSTDTNNNTFTGVRVVTVEMGRLFFLPANLVMIADQTVEVPAAGSDVTASAIEVLIEEGTTETMLRASFTASSDVATTVMVSLGQGTNVADSGVVTLDITATEANYTIYFRVTEAMTAADLVLSFGAVDADVALSAVMLNSSSEKDTVNPEIRNTESVVFIPVDSSAAEILMFVANGVSAVDDLDGLLTSSMVIDSSSVDATKLGLYLITYTVSDAAGNETVMTRFVATVQLVDLAVLTDPSFDTNLFNETEMGSEGGSGGANTYSVENGELTMHIGDSAGEWTSHTKFWINGLDKNTFSEGSTYVIAFDARAEQNRTMNVRTGLSLWDNPWIDDFTGGTTNIDITTEMTTYYVVFNADKVTSDMMNGDTENPQYKLELNLGVVTWGDEEKNNAVTLDNIHIYAVNARETDIIADGEFDNFGEADSFWGTETGGDASMTVNTEGQLEVAVVDNPGGWTSNTKIYAASGLALELDHVYQIDITVKAEKARQIQITLGEKLWADPWFVKYLGGDVVLNVTEEMTTYSLFFTVDSEGHASKEFPSIEIGMGPISWGDEEKNNVITFESINVVEYLSNDDTTRPTITGNDSITSYLNDTVDFVTGMVATDDVDGDITASIVIDSSAVDMTTVGTYTVTYTVADAAGNSTTVNRSVDVLDASSPAYIEFDMNNFGMLDAGDGSTATSAVVDGAYVVTLGTRVGDWASATKVKLSGMALATDQLYKVTIEVKSDVARKLAIRFGEDLGMDPWIADYQGSTAQFVSSTEYTTLTFLFYTDQGVGSNVMEIQMGSFDWAAEETNNTIYIKSMRIDKMEDTSAPTINGTSAITVSTDVAFDAMNGVWASDDVQVTSLVVTGTVDQATPGTYTLTYTATDFVGNETVVTRDVTVVSYTVGTSVNMLTKLDLMLDADETNNDNNAIDNLTITEAAGVYQFAIGSDIGGWSSATKVKLTNLAVTEGNMYRFKITLKADTARQLQLRFGESLWADPWFADYTGSNVIRTAASGDDYVTIEVIFTADSFNNENSNGYNALEFMFGPITWGSEEANNNIYITEFLLEEITAN